MAARVRALEEHERNRPACPSPKCAIHDEEIEDLDDRVSYIEDSYKKSKELRRTCTDYVMNCIIGFGSALIGFFAGKGG